MPESEDPKNDLRNSQFGGGFINADTVNARAYRCLYLEFFLWTAEPRSFGNPARSENQRLLLTQVKHEVEARLEQSPKVPRCAKYFCLGLSGNIH